MSGRYSNSWTVTINKPAAAAFDFVANPNTHTSWSPRPFQVVDIVGEPGEVGTSFTSIGWLPGDSEHRNWVEVTAAQRPNMVEFTSTDGDDHFVNRFEFAEVAGVTTVTRRADWARPKGAVSLAFPLIVLAIIGPDVSKGLRKLKTALEAA